MIGISNITELDRLLSDVRVVRPQLVARRADLDAEQFEQRYHYYAIDTNILYFVTQPTTTTLEQTQIRKAATFGNDASSFAVPHIGSIFRTDPRHYHLTIGIALAQFIGKKLGATSPLFMPNALWPEIDNLLTHFASYDDESVTTLADRLCAEFEKRMVRTLSDQLVLGGQDIPGIERPLRELVRQKIGRKSGLVRLRELFSQGRIESLASRPVQGLRGKLGDVQFEQRRLEEPLIAKWDLALREAGKVFEAHRLLDARALAQIQARNLIAQREGSRERVLYLTADIKVLVAARNMMVEELGMSFAEAFVRHPCAYLNDIGLGVGRSSLIDAARTDTDPASIVDWIEVLNAENPTDISMQAGKLSMREGRRQKSLAGAESKRIKDSWRKLANIQEEQLFFQLGIREIEQKLHEILADGTDGAVSKLQDMVITREIKAWQDCFHVAAELALRHDPRSPIRPIRSVPPICFEGWPGAGASIEKFKIWGYSGLSSRDEYNSLRDRLMSIDDTGYAYYLAFASFFAARGDWQPAASLAAFSREMAFRRPEVSRAGANGREGCFLEAVCRRHIARRPAELARARLLLNECERIFEEEKQSADGPMQIVPERFELERLDLAQTELLFVWAKTKEGDFDYSEQIAALLSLYGLLQKRLRGPVDEWLELPVVDTVELGSAGHVRIQTEIRTIASALVLVSIDGIKNDELPVKLIGSFIERLNVLRTRTRGNPSSAHEMRDGRFRHTNDISILAELGLVVSTILIDGPSKRSMDMRMLRDAFKTLNELTAGRRGMLSFDGKRFSAMLKVIKRHGRW